MSNLVVPALADLAMREWAEMMKAHVSQLEADLAECRRVCASLAERCHGQSEVLARQAEG